MTAQKRSMHRDGKQSGGGPSLVGEGVSQLMWRDFSSEVMKVFWDVIKRWWLYAVNVNATEL